MVVYVHINPSNNIHYALWINNVRQNIVCVDVHLNWPILEKKKVWLCNFSFEIRFFFCVQNIKMIILPEINLT